MFSLIKKVIALGLLAGGGFLLINTTANNESSSSLMPWQSPFIEEVMLNSSRFTREDDLRMVAPETIIEIHDHDVLKVENNRYALFLNEETLAFKILDKTTNYVWSTGIDEPDAGMFNSLLQSGIGIEYINIMQNYVLRENIGLLQTEFTAEIKVSNDTVEIDIHVETRGSAEIGVQFTLTVTLTENGIIANIPYESIEESNTDQTRLTSLILFPSLGATTMDEIPGYMIIPDGAGALIRYEDNEGRFRVPYEERFYGLDQGVVSLRHSVTNYPLSMPMFGAVHGVHQHAFLGIIESGAMNARLLAYPNGARNTPYNMIFPKFDINRSYRQSFTSDGRGGSMRIFETSHEDIRVEYRFLSDQQADYVGVALAYQEYLQAHDILENLVVNQDVIPIHLQYLMADSKRRIIGKTVIPMSSTHDVQAMYDFFIAQGLTHQRVSLLGWNRGGYSANYLRSIRFERAIGSRGSFEELIAHITEQNTLMLIHNYLNANESSGISYRNDVAEGVNRFKLDTYCATCVYREHYMLYPKTTYQIASDDLKVYQDLGVDVLFERLGSTLFSYYDSDTFTRDNASEYYQMLMQAYQGIGHYYYPHAWAWAYLTDFYHTPLYNSQMAYFDDLVPLLPIVLRGHVEMYSSFLNFNSLGQMQLLRLVDFGINPSYILSEARSSDLVGTDIEHLYATQFSMWDETIVSEYEYINNALRHVLGARIIERHVHSLGLVEVVYENGVSILINYTRRDEIVDDHIVKAFDYTVIGVGQ